MKTNDIFNSSPHESPLLDELIGNTGELTTLTAEQQIRIAALNAATRISSNIPHSYSADERVIAFHNALKYYEKYITTGETK